KKLLIAVGFEKYDGSKQKEYQLKELNRYLIYEKTGKLFKDKPTNEIVITEIYDIPKEKMDNRSNNGGNNTSIISDYMRNWIEIALESDGSIDGSASKIIRDMNLVIDDFSNAYYNFDDCFTDCTTIEKNFFLDYCDVVMNSYKQRLKRIINNFAEYEDVLYKEYYKVSFIKESKDGEFYATDDIEDLKTIDKIDRVKHNLEISYGVKENNKKWKLYCDRKKSKQFYDDFIQQVRKLLKRDEITNCYKSMYLFSYDYHADVNEDFDNQKFWNTQKKFAENKIDTIFNKTNRIYNPMEYGKYIKIPKYKSEDISQDMIEDCKEMVMYQ
ncbi:MAG: hypothetical protein LKJ17_00005, partial [Oscillospiraceae bacterium]|nr:hypothetical protein [Oscillospiraceae bacterium]